VWQGSEAVEYWAASLAVSYDVVVVGAGVVGCALARELSLRRCLPREVRQPHEQQQQQEEGRLRVLLLDARHDVGEATSKGNAAIVHTGFDAEPGTLESELVVQASRE
jgi:glycerol-3-phosphate dehydrogenase